MATYNNTNDSADDTNVPKDEYWEAQTRWSNELTAANREWDIFIKRGDAIVTVYAGDDQHIRRAKPTYPLFNANVSILENALFARIPQPEVTRRFRDPGDQVGRVAALIVQRALSTELEGNSAFNVTAKSIIKDMLIPGMGVGWVRYEADTEEVQLSDDENDELDDFETASPILKDQQTPIDYVHWKDFRMSPCRTFNECSWVARRVYMDEDECERRFGERAKYLNYSSRPYKDSESDGWNEPQYFTEPQAEIWEIWDKDTKKVYFICTTSPSALDIQDDPLGLPDFFPTDKPLVADAVTSRFMPIADFTTLEAQYNDLNVTNSRIIALVRSARLTGVYDPAEPALAELLEGSSEHQMIAAQNFSAFKAQGGIGGSMEFLPLGEVNQTIGGLRAHLQSLKEQIYELTGISDIVRGETSPYETAEAQGIKMQNASIRLQGKQAAVAEYLTSLIRRKAFLMLKFYTPERLMQRCGVLAPADQQYVPQALQLLQNELMTYLRLDVTTDSLQQQTAHGIAQRTQAVQGIAAVLQQAVPAAQQVPALAPFLGQLCKYAASAMPGATELEGELESALENMRQQSQQPKQPSPEEQKAQAEAQAAQQQMQFEQQMAQAELQWKREQAAAELQLKREQMLAELQLKRDVEMAKAAQKQVPQFVQGDMGLDADALGQLLQQMQATLVQSQVQSTQTVVNAMTEIANQPPEPIHMKLTRNAEGGLDGVAV